MGTIEPLKLLATQLIQNVNSVSNNALTILNTKSINLSLIFFLQQLAEKSDLLLFSFPTFTFLKCKEIILNINQPYL